MMKSSSKEYEVKVNEILANVLNTYIKEDSTIKAAMTYALLDGGKRLRPQLFMRILESYDVDYQLYQEVIGAIEMIHTYSLVHDDLPTMDDGQLRHGKPTTHIRFNEGVAVLTGDALLNDAFYVLSNANVTSDKLVLMMRFLSLSSGANGMILGQCLDIDDKVEVDLALINKINLNKTGALFMATTTLAAIVVDQSVADFSKLGLYLGLAFQIQDDILDVIKNPDELGKDTQADNKNNKQNIVTYLGLQQAQLKVEEYFSKVDAILVKHNLEETSLAKFIEDIKDRQN